MLVDQKREQAAAGTDDNPIDPADYANFRFHTFNDVKQVIYQAYKKRLPNKSKEKAAKEKEK